MHEIHGSNEVLMWPKVVMSTLLGAAVSKKLQEIQSKFHHFVVSGRQTVEKIHNLCVYTWETIVYLYAHLNTISASLMLKFTEP